MLLDVPPAAHHSGTTALCAAGQLAAAAAAVCSGPAAGCLHETSKVHSSGGDTIPSLAFPTAIT